MKRNEETTWQRALSEEIGGGAGLKKMNLITSPRVKWEKEIYDYCILTSWNMAYVCIWFLAANHFSRLLYCLLRLCACVREWINYWLRVNSCLPPGLQPSTVSASSLLLTSLLAKQGKGAVFPFCFVFCFFSYSAIYWTQTAICLCPSQLFMSVWRLPADLRGNDTLQGAGQ